MTDNTNETNRNYPLPEHEDDRLETLNQFHILDTPPSESVDRITSLTSQILDAPVSLISLVDRDREWHKSAAGTEPTENPQNASFCTHAMMRTKPLVVTDVREDERFQDLPLVTGEIKLPLSNRKKRCLNTEFEEYVMKPIR